MMKVQVILVVCSVFLQNSYGATIQAQPADAKTQILNPNPELTDVTFVSNASIQLVKIDSNTSITYPTDYDDVPLDINDPKADARAIRNALTASKVNTNSIVAALSGKTRAQRLRVAEEYKLLFKAEITKDLKQKLGDHWLTKLVIDLLIPLKEYYVKELHEAMHGAGTNEDTLIEILCTMNNEEIKQIKEIYEKTYKATLKSHIQYETAGDFEELLVALLNADRDESGKVKKKWGTDESTFITILTQSNYEQLKLIFDEYKTLTGHSFEYAIECEFSSFIQRGLLAIVKAAHDLPKYYAERLHSSVAGSGTNNKRLIRIITTRNEIDMDLIKTHYKEDYGITLEDAIADDTSGDYKTLLLELIRENPCRDTNLLGCTFITIRAEEESNP
ncbi:hypothetical protein ILUMI_08317 [Ignelater luminosus]|uniref:Annexin n=1 Tax=Ignelater luminosus TaxID=2038154 RepID=A0A8K0D5V9_IGNLU|nr:hypothetical protein ILUMI_08317 [Ignelater luminosus]